ncbi:Macrolide-specific efflux protein MacA precursor [Luteitalea pratensis]|uniref:Macrolide-specific efflux protein MacA n=1 Tax=Luteitalea pratensis TaxID=1855912 RepID=A0A143PG55_LUTPR|nr:efflux RND transporter periplasmic adaptor subunit [Luteitalea pratensis]AMY07233.1 Macrolide-specific efflux protein MacA precursor [Luteitalea pratensis]
MNDLRTDLAALKLDRDSRGAAVRSPGRWVALVLVLLAAGGGWWYWNRPVIAHVKTTAVVARGGGAGSPDDAVLNASGYVTARRRATVSSRITGKVVSVHVEEGMAVRQGQVLARLEDSTARAMLQLAEAQLASARNQLLETEVRIREAELALGRQQRLEKEGVVPAADLDTANAQVDALRARLQAARTDVNVAEQQVALRHTDMDDTVIRAPFSGMAVSKDAQPGEMISPVSAGGGFTRTGICTIVDMTSLEIEVDVNESYITRVSDRQPVRAVLDAYPDWSVPAHVITTVPTADRQKATVLVRIGFDALDPRLLPDMGVKVTFLKAAPVASETAQAPTLWVPTGAVRREGGAAPFVFVAAGGRAVRRSIQVGRTSGTDTQVTSGIAAGDRVIVDAPATLADGSSIEEARP